MESKISNSVSSGYSSIETSGNSSPDLDSSGSRTSDPRVIDRDRLHERLSRIDQNEFVRSNSISSLTTTPGELNNVKQIARDLSDDLMHHVVGIGRRKPSSKHAETLRRTSQEMFNRHEIFFKNVASKMQIDRNTANVIFKNVADDMLTDGRCNWGRIVALYTFGARLAQHVYTTSNDKNERFVSQIGTFVGNYIVDNLSEWILSNGGWVRFRFSFCLRLWLSAETYRLPFLNVRK